MCLKWDFFGIEWNCATICKQLQIRIISKNIFSLILMVYRHRKLGSPAICFVASRQASHTINIGSADRAVEDSCRLVNITIKAINRVGLLCFILIYTPQQ